MIHPINDRITLLRVFADGPTDLESAAERLNPKPAEAIVESTVEAVLVELVNPSEVARVVARAVAKPRVTGIRQAVINRRLRGNSPGRGVPPSPLRRPGGSRRLRFVTGCRSCSSNASSRSAVANDRS